MSGQITGQKKKKNKTNTPHPQNGDKAPLTAGGGTTGGWEGAAPTNTVTTTANSKVQFDADSKKAPVSSASSRGTTRLIAESHIKLMEADRVLAATVDFGDLMSEERKESEENREGAEQSDVAGKLCNTLLEHGFAVVSNVLSEEEVVALEALWAADLTSIVSTHLKANTKEMKFVKDPAHQWPSEDRDFALGTKFATKYGLPQGQCAWATRAHPNVKKVYEIIYGSEKLCVGLDNVFFNPKRSMVNTDCERTSNLWPHADQNSGCQPEGRYDVYQSVVYLWPADLDSSATVVWPGSNNSVYSKLMQQTNAKGHFCMLPKTDHEAFAHHARRIPVPRGGMLLWSSKTIHQGWPHGPRLAIPVCFEPSHRRSEEALKRKIQCVKAGKPTTHWASLGKPHSMSSMANGDTGGSEVIKLVHKAHFHAVNEKGELLTFVEKLL